LNKVAIVTDTISTIPQQMAQECGIKIVPLYVVMDGKDYPETEVDRQQLYERIRKKDRSITTSSPSPGSYLKAYEELSQKAESVLCITFAPSLGMAYKAATQALQIAKEELPQATIIVIDCQTACGAQLLLVLAAAKAAAQGGSLDEILELVNDLMARLNYIALLPTPGAEQMKNERRATYMDDDRLKSMASPQSIMEMGASTEGVMTILAKVESRAEGMEKLIEIARDRSAGKKLHVAINYSGTQTYDEAEELKRRLPSQFQCSEIYLTQDSLIPALHEGIGTLKLCWYSEE